MNSSTWCWCWSLGTLCWPYKLWSSLFFSSAQCCVVSCFKISWFSKSLVYLLINFYYLYFLTHYFLIVMNQLSGYLVLIFWSFWDSFSVLFWLLLGYFFLIIFEFRNNHFSETILQNKSEIKGYIKAIQINAHIAATLNCAT